ncbi:MAG: hypothetical protein ACP5JR_05930, partial [Thermoplasmata archaeon]
MAKEKPRIVGESKKEIVNKEPPAYEFLAPHEWTSKEGFELFKQTIESSKIFDVYISKNAEEKILLHALKYKSQNLEVMGFLLGDIYKFDNKIYAVVRDIVTSDLDASAVHVKFDKESYEKLFEQLEEVPFDYILVGWYHSHPGHTCFLSSTDISTQTKMFPHEYHSAIVVDPINEEFAVFGVKDMDYYLRPAAIFWEELQKPYDCGKWKAEMNKIQYPVKKKKMLKKKENGITDTKTCPRCKAEIGITELVCPNCKFEFEVPSIQESLASLSEKYQELEKLKEELAVREDALKSKESDLYVWEEDLKMRENKLQENYSEINKKIGELTEWENWLKAEEERIKQIGIELNRKVQAFEQMSQDLRKKEENLAAQMYQLEMERNALNAKYEELGQWEERLKEAQEYPQNIGNMPEEMRIKLENDLKELRQIREEIRIKEKEQNLKEKWILDAIQSLKEETGEKERVEKFIKLLEEIEREKRELDTKLTEQEMMTAMLTEKERVLQEKEAWLKAEEDRARILASQLEERERQVNQLLAENSAKSEELDKTKISLAKAIEETSAKANELRETMERIKKEENEIVRMKQELESRRVSMEEKEKVLYEKEEFIKGETEKLKAMNLRLSEKEKELGDKERSLGELEKLLSEEKA